MDLRRNRRGVALLLVLTSVVIITVLVVELHYASRITSTMANNYKNELTAYYLARSSINVALLRLAIFNKIKKLEIGGFQVPTSVLSLVWSFPFIFPPPAELFSMAGAIGGGEPDLGVKEMLRRIKENTNIASVGYFDHNIGSLDAKININYAAMTEEGIQGFKEQMKHYYSFKIESDESFGHRYPIEDFDILLNNIMDWIDSDSDSRNGGYENSYYERRDPPYKVRNGPMPTLSELHMIEGMDDELFDFLSPMLTVFSSGSLNVNRMSPEMWKTIDSRLMDEEIVLIKEKLELEGFFKDDKELRSWIGQNTTIVASDFNPLKLPLSFDDSSFKIEATGYSGRVSKKIVCYISEVYSELLTSGEVKKEQPETAAKPKKVEKKKKGKKVEKKEKAEPTIVYWEME